MIDNEHKKEFEAWVSAYMKKRLKEMGLTPKKYDPSISMTLAAIRGESIVNDVYALPKNMRN